MRGHPRTDGGRVQGVGGDDLPLCRRGRLPAQALDLAKVMAEQTDGAVTAVNGMIIAAQRFRATAEHKRWWVNLGHMNSYSFFGRVTIRYFRIYGGHGRDISTSPPTSWSGTEVRQGCSVNS
jgi:hypothetical protein